MVKKFKIIASLLFVLLFVHQTKAQQLVLKPNFNGLVIQVTNGVSGGCSVLLQDGDFNSTNSGSHIKTFIYGYKDTIVVRYPNGNLGYATPYSNHFGLQLMNYNNPIIYGDSVYSFIIQKHPNIYVPTTDPRYCLGYYSKVSMGGVSFELAQKLEVKKLYVLKLYTCYSTYSSQCGEYIPSLFHNSGLNIGISSTDTLFGSNVVSVMPLIRQTVCFAPLDETMKRVRTFIATDTAKYLTLMGDYDTTTASSIRFNNVTLFPAYNLGTRNVYTCKGDVAKLTPHFTGKTYDWSIGDTTKSINVTDTGWYVCYINQTDSVLIDSVHLLYNTLVINPSTNITICKGINTIIQSSNVKSGNKYLWNSGDTSLQIQVNNAGLYYVITSSDSTCTKIDSFVVSAQLKAPLLLPNDTVFCKADTFLLDAQTTAYNKYKWNTLDTTSYIKVNKAGKYYVTASNGVCTNADTINVQIFNLPKLNLRDTNICKQNNFIINVANSNYTKYLWNTNDTTAQITIHDSGYYYVTASNGYCTTNDSVHVSFYKMSSLKLVTDTNLCEGNKILLDVFDTTYKTYLWNTGVPTSAITITQPGKYKVIASNGLCNTSDSVNVTLQPLPFIILTKDTIVCFDELNAILLSAPVGYASYRWYPTSETTPSIFAKEARLYAVEVTDKNGCINRDTTLIDEECKLRVWVPNAFTPNNDGVNDIFRITALHASEATLQIYNRWGEQIFNTGKALQEGWDGNQAIDGEYLYIVHCTSKDRSQNQNLKGTFRLMK